MKRVKLYISDRVKELVMVLILWIFMLICMEINSVSANEMIYVSILVVVMLLVYLCIDGYRWIQKYNLIINLSDQSATDNITNVFNNINTHSELEKSYIGLINNIIEDGVVKTNKSSNRQRDMQEYYSMWVHQIKTPIAALRLLLEAENEEGQHTEKLGELFRIEQYVDMALQYVRIDSEDTDFVFAENKLDPIIRASIRKYARLFIGKKIALNYEGTDISVMTDAKWMGFVVEQLLANAVKYTNKGSVTITVEKQGDKTKLIIEDTGIGIRAEDLPRICEKGYTGYNGHANEHSTGIGLYLCNQIIKKLGHEIEFSSTEGAGTKVEILFYSNYERTE